MTAPMSWELAVVECTAIVCVTVLVIAFLIFIYYSKGGDGWAR